MKFDSGCKCEGVDSLSVFLLSFVVGGNFP